MSTANAKHGSVNENRSGQATPPQAAAQRPALSLYPDQGNVFAQIPDLDKKSAPRVHGKSADGRIISQALSIKLVFGVGLALLVVAILPFVFGKASRPAPVVTELPAWSTSGGSTGIAGDTAQSVAPIWPASSGVPLTAARPAQAAPAILQPQQPQIGDTRTMAPTEPSWSQSRSPAAQAPAAMSSAGPNYDNRRPMAAATFPDNRGDYRGFDRNPQASIPDARNLQADNRNVPAAQYRHNDTQYDYRGNPINALPARPDVPTGGYSRDTRYDNGGAYPPAAAPGGALMPSGVQGPTSTYPDAQNSEPGVARFEGTIATPPLRTSYDRAGSSPN